MRHSPVEQLVAVDVMQDRLDLAQKVGVQETFDPTQWHMGGFTVVNSSPSSRLRDPFPPAIRLIHQGIIDMRPLVTHVQPLPKYPMLMDQILHGDKSYVKGVITLA